MVVAMDFYDHRRLWDINLQRKRLGLPRLRPAILATRDGHPPKEPPETVLLRRRRDDRLFYIIDVNRKSIIIESFSAGQLDRLDGSPAHSCFRWR